MLLFCFLTPYPLCKHSFRSVSFPLHRKLSSQIGPRPPPFILYGNSRRAPLNFISFPFELLIKTYYNIYSPVTQESTSNISSGEVEKIRANCAPYSVEIDFKSARTR